MASFKLSRTTTISTSSATIEHADHTFAGGQKIEISAQAAGVWINTVAGTASAGGDNCFHLPQNSSIVYTFDDAEANLTAIRDGSTDCLVTVSYVED